MPEWLLFILIGWLVFRVCGRRGMCVPSGWQSREVRERRQPERIESSRAPAAPPPEAIEAKLRRRYVSGELSVEEYERELDMLYRR